MIEITVLISAGVKAAEKRLGGTGLSYDVLAPLNQGRANYRG